jgi:hypothetical protein
LQGAANVLTGATAAGTAPPTVGAGTAGMSGVDIATGMTGTTALPSSGLLSSAGAVSPYVSQAAQQAAQVASTTSAVAPSVGGALSGLSGTDIAVGMSGAGATPGVAASTLPITASSVGQMVASQGLLPDVVNKVAELTGLKPDTVSSLGSAAVQSLLSAYGANKTAEQQQQAAQTLADAQVKAAQIAAESAKFRPVGVTTRFGTSKFTTDAQGNVIGAGYAPSEEILGYQQRLSGLANRGLAQAELAPVLYAPLMGAGQRLFSLGGQYLEKSPEAVAADYIAKQQALLAPSRQTQLAELQNKLMQQGRLGAAVSQGGKLMPTSPEMAAYYNALAQQDLQLAAAGDTEAQRRIQFGAGLFDTGAGLTGKYYTGQTAAYQPFATAMDTTAGLESLAQQPMTLGTQIGAKTTASAAEAGRLLSQGITGAAQTMYPSQAFSGTGQFVSGLAQSPLVKSAISSAFGVPQTTGQQMYTFDPTTNQFKPVSSTWST